MEYHFYDFVGNVGVVLVLGCYLLVQTRKMTVTGVPYTVLNIVGAAMILYSLYFEFNLSAVVIEIAWLLISLVGLGRIILEKRATRRETDPTPGSP